VCRVLATTGLVWLGLVALACGGGPEPRLAPSPLGVASPVCAAEPVLPSSVPFVPSKSRVAVVVEVEDSSLQQLFDDVLPTTVASDKDVKAGAAGRASYEIKRGVLTATAGSHGVELLTRLRGDIQLCKPLGAVCFGYGRCYPEWEAKVTLPRQVTQAHTPHVGFDLKLRKGCVLSPVRFDATSQLKEITDQQERKIEEQINRSLGNHFKRLRSSWAEGFGTYKLASGACVSVEPESARVALRTPSEGNGTKYTAVAELSSVTRLNCEQRALAPSFAVAVSDNVPHDTHVVTEHVVPWSSLEQEWAQAEPNVRVSVRPSGSEIFVRLAPFGGCQAAWGRFSPQLTAGSIRLAPLQVSDTTLSTWVAQRGPLAAVQTAHHQAIVRELAARFAAPIEAESTFTKNWRLVLAPRLNQTHDVTVTDEGLVIRGQLRGTVHGQVTRTKR
jgi:hypothetical protein